MASNKTKTDRTSDDKESLQGVWHVISSECAKRKPRRIAYKYEFDGEQVILHFDDGNSIVHKFRLRPSAEPKEIDLLHEDEPYYIEEHGIYKFRDDGRLTLCLTPALSISGPVELPPTKFETTNFYARRVLELERR